MSLSTTFIIKIKSEFDEQRQKALLQVTLAEKLLAGKKLLLALVEELIVAEAKEELKKDYKVSSFLAAPVFTNNSGLFFKDAIIGGDLTLPCVSCKTKEATADYPVCEECLKKLDAPILEGLI